MTIHIFGGGTIQHVRNHMALCAPAYGNTARKLAGLFSTHGHRAQLHLTRMADHCSLMETNQDVEARLLEVLREADTTSIIFNVALCDFQGVIPGAESGKYATRLSSRDGAQAMQLSPTPKLLSLVREHRPDVLLVGFKTTAGATEDQQHKAARRQMDETGANMVFCNDTSTRHNILVRQSSRVIGARGELLVALAMEVADAEENRIR